MKKIMIIGCGGSGKSTLSKRIHRITGLPLIHLDKVFWLPGWIELDRSEWIKKNQEIIKKDYWIIDGNYGSTMDMRMAEADTIIFLNRPTHVLLWRVIKRTMLNLGRTRNDLPENCPDKLDFKFFYYIANYNKSRKPGILKKLNKFQKEKTLLIFRNDKEIKNFIINLKKLHG